MSGDAGTSVQVTAVACERYGESSDTVIQTYSFE
jgi:hypothetical protein